MTEDKKLMRLLTYVVDAPAPPFLLYFRRIVDLFERRTARMSVSQNLEFQSNQK